MAAEILELQLKLERVKGERDRIKKDLKAAEDSIQRFQDEIRDSEEAIVIINKVAQETQAQLEYVIRDLCSMAQEAVFYDDPRGCYAVGIEFVTKRNQTEAEVYFERNGRRYYDPLRNKACGGGAIDVGGFAFRIADWSITKPKKRNTMLLDEPFKHIKGDEANRRVIQMVNQISSNIPDGLQIIMVSDERVKVEDIVKGADKVFIVDADKSGVATIRELTQSRRSENAKLNTESSNPKIRKRG